MTLVVIGFFGGCLAMGLFFLWLDDQRAKAERAGWTPQREALRVLSTSPRWSLNGTAGEDGATGSATRRATFEQTDVLVHDGSTAARESSPRFGSRAVLLTDR